MKKNSLLIVLALFCSFSVLVNAEGKNDIKVGARKASVQDAAPATIPLRSGLTLTSESIPDSQRHRNSLTEFFELVFTPKWFADNIGTTIGAFFGSLLAYGFGYLLLRKQFNNEKLRQEENRLRLVAQFFEDANDILDALVKNTSEALEICRNSKLTQLNNIYGTIGQIQTVYLNYRGSLTIEQTQYVKNLKLLGDLCKPELEKHEEAVRMAVKNKNAKDIQKKLMPNLESIWENVIKLRKSDPRNGWFKITTD